MVVSEVQFSSARASVESTLARVSVESAQIHASVRDLRRCWGIWPVPVVENSNSIKTYNSQKTPTSDS